MLNKLFAAACATMMIAAAGASQAADITGAGSEMAAKMAAEDFGCLLYTSDAADE